MVNFSLKKDDNFLDLKCFYFNKILIFNFIIVKTTIRLIELRLFISFEIKLKLALSNSDKVLL